jgi:hypothetical protein
LASITSGPGVPVITSAPAVPVLVAVLPPQLPGGVGVGSGSGSGLRSVSQAIRVSSALSAKNESAPAPQAPSANPSSID